MSMRTLLYVGTYTHPSATSPQANAKGIYVFDFDPVTGQLRHLHEIEGIDDPSYLAIDSQHRWLYAVSEVYTGMEGTISAYAINKANGELTYINKQVTLGNLTAYVGVDQADRCVMVSNYGLGKNAAAFSIRDDGGLTPATSSIDYSAEMPRNRLHSHCIVPDPSNQFAYIADLGIDKIMIFRLNAANGSLTPNTIPSFDMEPGSGPRHFVFHPNGKFAYVINEYLPAITVFAHDASSGALRKLQTESPVPSGYSGPYEGAAIHLTPSGKFLYGSVRQHNSIAMFAVDENSGLLTGLGNQVIKGQTPRDFTIDPTGVYLLVGAMSSNTIQGFKINPQSGKLEDTGQVTPCPTPTCLKMIQV